MKLKVKKLGFCILVFLGISGIYLILFRKIPWSEIHTFSTYILLLTLLAILYYAYETRLLRIKTVEQTEFSFRPYLVIYYSKSTRNLYIKNIGNGPAVYIKIEDYHDTKGKVDLLYRFECSSILERGCIFLVEYYIRKANEFVKDDLFRIFPTLPHSYEVEISYTNFMGKEYSNTTVLGKGMLETEEVHP